MTSIRPVIVVLQEKVSAPPISVGTVYPEWTCPLLCEVSSNLFACCLWNDTGWLILP